jgi:hypothetical protein
MYGVEAAAEKADIHSRIFSKTLLPRLSKVLASVIVAGGLGKSCCRTMFPLRRFAGESFAEPAASD